MSTSRRRSLLAVCAWLVSLVPAVQVSAQAAGASTYAFDRTIRPQDDFYGYVNGPWLEKNDIPPYFSSWGTGPELQVRIWSEIRSILESPRVGPHALDPDSRKVSDLYHTFINEQRIESSGLTPLRDELARVAAIATPGDVATLLAHFVRAGIASPITLSVHPDDKDPTRYIADLEQSDLSLPDRDYYLSDDPRFRTIRAEYRAHVERVLALAADKSAVADAAIILDFETRLAAAQWTRVENRDPVKTYNRVMLSDLDSVAPGLHWSRVVAELGLARRVSFVNVSEPSYFNALGVLVERTPPSVWRAYFRWCLVNRFSPFLPRRFADESSAFSGTLFGDAVSRPRWMRAVTFVDDRMGYALGRIYVQQYFPLQAKARAQALIDNLLAAFRSRIVALDWMSPETKREAQAKIDALVVKLGSPDRREDYTKLHTNPTDLIANLLNVRSFRYQRDLDRLGKPVDRSEWGMSPATVNGYYSALRNEVVLPAALMQPPYFQPDADDAVNYGGLGWFIAHELSHAFDNRGNQYDSKGNLRDWWTKNDHEQFAARSQALIEQYSRYEPVSGMFINGQLTVGENIADNLGLSIAYDAYHLSLGSRVAPVINGLTGDQRFYVSYATIWAAKERQASAIAHIKSDTHSPAKFRVQGAVVNQDSFYAAFGVHAGDGMFVPPEKRVKIW
jgi:putative endopeptidase